MTLAPLGWALAARGCSMAMPGNEWSRGVAAREPGAPLSEMLGQLLWPRLFRAPGLALRPSRVFVGLLMVVLLELICRLPELWHGEAWRQATAWPAMGLGEGPMWMGPLAFFQSLWNWGWGAATLFPWSAALVKLLSLVVLAFGGCMISRMAACDFSLSVVVGVAEARHFTRPRLGSVLFAVLAPVVLAGLIALGLAVGGWVLFGIPYVNVLGAVLYGLFLLAGAVIVVILLAYALGYPMLIPAVACEGADGIDAVGRVYPYVFSRPLRLMLYYAVAIALGWLAVSVAFWLLGLVAQVTETATAWLLSGTAGTTFTSSPRADFGDVVRPGGGEAAAYIVNFWTGLLMLLGWAYGVSYAFCAATIVYLLMRRVCDGQDTTELWMPGMVEGTMAESMRGRAEVAGTACPPQPPATA